LQVALKLYQWWSLALTSCNFKSALALAGTLNEVTIVQQTIIAVELALKEHSTLLWQLKSEETIDAELYKVVQVSICSIQVNAASYDKTL